jgi:hypothetical protein
MSKENVALMREVNEAFNRDDYGTWINAFDPECEFWPLRAHGLW